MTVFREVISSIPGVFRSKWSDLPLFQASPVVVDANAEVEFGVDLDRLDELAQLIAAAGPRVVEEHCQEWEHMWCGYSAAAEGLLSEPWPAFPTFAQMWADA